MAGKQLTEYRPDYTLFDLETTGLNTNTDAIVEISAVKVRGGAVIDEFSALVNPGRSNSASWVNNISDSMLLGQPVIEAVLPDFLDFIGDDVLAGHNIRRFDIPILARDCASIDHPLENDWIDTLEIAKLVYPEWHHRRLADLAEHYSLINAQAHRALSDCLVNQQIYERLFEDLKSRPRPEVKLCPKCGKPMKRRVSRFGPFWGCGGYPACKYTENIKE